MRIRSAFLFCRLKGWPRCCGHPEYRLRDLLAATGRAALDRLKSLLDAQRSAHLAWRVLPERLQEATDQRNGRNHRPELFAPPAAVQHRLIRVFLPRVLSQVGHEGNVGRFFRAGEQVALDGLEAELPVGISNGGEVAIVGEVEKFLARTFVSLAFEERHEIVTV